MAANSLLTQATASRVQRAGEFLVRYGLVLVLVWIGLMKFTEFEAKGLVPLISTSPFMSWMYKIMNEQAASNLIGLVELTTALLIALRPIAPRASALGSVLAIGTFLTTLSFLLTLPGWEASLGGFPALSGAGGFLLKDIVLLGAAVWTLGDSLAAADRRGTK